jgi:ankyrin repeat protein
LADTPPSPSPDEVADVFQSARESDWETVTKMVEAKPELARCSSRSWTLLHSAALEGNEEVADLLLRKGAGIDAKTDQRKIEIWQKKLDGDEMPVDIPLENMRLSLHEIGREILVLWLPDSDTSRQSDAAGSECSALHIAAMCGRTSFLKFLLSKGANIAIVDKDGLSTLHYAARNKCEPLVNLLLSAGLDVNVLDKSGHTPLYDAIVEDQKEIVELLISKGADVNRPNSLNGNTPLHASMLCRNTPMVRLLIKGGANVDVRNVPGVAPLHMAAMNDLCDAVNLLIDQGADVNIRDHEGHTPLHHAALMGCPRVTQVLLARGAHRKAKDKSGQTPFDVAEMAAAMDRVDHPLSENEKAKWLYDHMEVAGLLRSR